MNSNGNGRGVEALASGPMRNQEFAQMATAIDRARKVDQAIKIFNEKTLKAWKELEGVLNGTNEINDMSTVLYSAERLANDTTPEENS